MPTTAMAMFPHDAGVGGGAAAASLTTANQACYSCRKQKRKCDKALPACSLCTRMARHCDYSEAQPAPTAEDLAALTEKIRQLEDRLNQRGGTSDGSVDYLSPSSFAGSHTPQMLPPEPLWQNGPSNLPPAVFLDSRMFQWSGMQIPKPTMEIPADVVSCIGNAEDLEQTLSDYFGDVHPWFPIISRKHMSIGYNLWEVGGDIALLILAMKLVTSQPQRGFTASENYLYTASKRHAALLESVGTTSLPYLQGLVLIALYEYGQGVYPAAYMSVGQCVRYAEYLGLHSYKDSSAILGHPLSWADAEERRRVWWAVYILDKMASMGSYRRPMCREPLPDDLLPTNDKAWDMNDNASAFQRPVVTPLSDAQPPYARLCQAALIASRSLQHHTNLEMCKIRGDRFDFNDVAHLTDDAHQLCKALEADFAASPTIFFQLVAARSLNFTAVLKVLSTYAYGESLRGVGSEWNEEEMAFQATAAAGIKKTSAYVRNLATDLSAFISLDEDVVKTPPMVLEAFYLASTTHHNLSKESNEPGAELSLETTRKCLVRLSGRWRLGKEFLDMLEAHEMNYIVGASYQASRLSGIPMVIGGMA